MSMGHLGGYMASRSYSRDRSVTDQRLAKGTARRILRYARPYWRHISVFLVTTVIAAASTELRYSGWMFTATLVGLVACLPGSGPRDARS